MRDGEQRSHRAQRFEAAKRPARQPQLRRTSPAEHLDISPQHATRMARSERLHRGFFRGEPSGKARNRIALARTIGNLLVGEDAPEKAFTMTREDLANARDVGGVETEADDAHARPSA